MSRLEIREIQPGEYSALGDLMIDVYSKLDGFPNCDEQPDYYEMLANIGRFSEKPNTKVLVACKDDNSLAGGVVYFSDMAQYGSGGVAPLVKDASGIRLLGVSQEFRGLGIGRALTNECIKLARELDHSQVVLHTTQAMKIAWAMYEKTGFKRSPDLDFLQEELSVFGFRLRLDQRR